MFSAPNTAIETRLSQLESHLTQENPVLLKTVQSFRSLDHIARKMGLLTPEHSFATQIPWWPLISVLGTFSSGKSTFINRYLDTELQRTGNQAVDDKFSVLCYSQKQTAHALPGVALDSDPRFPFYRISSEIELVAAGEGKRIDAYLQLKTCPSEQLRGKIVIDSPGFDADAQRNSTLRIADHIIDLSDLVLVFFDARHPEPGAMRDTLDHLVTKTISRSDSGKFLYILNQIDTTAREDNPEEVVAAWQRALGERGLTAGRFFTIYDREAGVPIEDESRRERFESKRDADLEEIYGRMHEVEIQRAYRIVAALDHTARDINERAAPLLQGVLRQWRRRVMWGDTLLIGVTALIALLLSSKLGYWQGWHFSPPWGVDPEARYFATGLTVAVLAALHFLVRSVAARTLDGTIRKRSAATAIRGNLHRAFQRNTRFWRSILISTPSGWNRRARKRLLQVLQESDKYVQTLNDLHTSPSGENLASTQHRPIVANTEE